MLSNYQGFYRDHKDQWDLGPALHELRTTEEEKANKQKQVHRPSPSFKPLFILNSVASETVPIS